MLNKNIYKKEVIGRRCVREVFTDGRGKDITEFVFKNTSNFKKPFIVKNVRYHIKDLGIEREAFELCLCPSICDCDGDTPVHVGESKSIISGPGLIPGKLTMIASLSGYGMPAALKGKIADPEKFREHCLENTVEIVMPYSSVRDRMIEQNEGRLERKPKEFIFIEGISATASEIGMAISKAENNIHIQPISQDRISKFHDEEVGKRILATGIERMRVMSFEEAVDTLLKVSDENKKK